MKRAHLTRVEVRTYWVVVDDDDSVAAVEMADTGVAVPAADWPGFYEQWVAQWAAVQRATSESADAPRAPVVAAPNRAARRAKPSRGGPARAKAPPPIDD